MTAAAAATVGRSVSGLLVLPVYAILPAARCGPRVAVFTPDLDLDADGLVTDLASEWPRPSAAEEALVEAVLEQSGIVHILGRRRSCWCTPRATTRRSCLLRARP